MLRGLIREPYSRRSGEPSAPADIDAVALRVEEVQLVEADPDRHRLTDPQRRVGLQPHRELSREPAVPTGLLLLGLSRGVRSPAAGTTVAVGRGAVQAGGDCRNTAPA